MHGTNPVDYGDHVHPLARVFSREAAYTLVVFFVTAQTFPWCQSKACPQLGALACRRLNEPGNFMVVQRAGALCSFGGAAVRVAVAKLHEH